MPRMLVTRRALAHPQSALLGRGLLLVPLLALTLLSTSRARADALEDFYRSKSVNLIVGYSSGGGYDIYARSVARYLGNHLPGQPKVVVTNMPGAGSLVSVNHLYNIAPKDGTAIATFGRGLPMEPLIGSTKVQFDATKLTWIGSVTSELSVCAVTQKSKVITFEDSLSIEAAVGGEGSGSDPDTYASLVRNLFGSKMKLVTGYPGGNEMTLAIERGELDGRCGWSWGSIKATRPDWVSGPNKLRVLLQMTLERSHEMPDVPTVAEAGVPGFESLSWVGLIAPTGTPPEIIAKLHDEIAKLLRLPDVQQLLASSGMEATPTTPEEFAAYLKSEYDKWGRVVRDSGATVN